MEFVEKELALLWALWVRKVIGLSVHLAKEVLKSKGKNMHLIINWLTVLKGRVLIKWKRAKALVVGDKREFMEAVVLDKTWEPSLNI
jgi:hypothetical protein